MKETILVVEDDKSLREALASKLKSVGYAVVEASDGVEGLEMALSGHPDLIVLDIVMPKMDGEEMLKKLREDEWGKTVKVILLSNLSFTNDPKSLSKTDEYLLKARTDLSELVAKIKAHLL